MTFVSWPAAQSIYKPSAAERWSGPAQEAPALLDTPLHQLSMPGQPTAEGTGATAANGEAVPEDRGAFLQQTAAAAAATAAPQKTAAACDAFANSLTMVEKAVAADRNAADNQQLLCWMQLCSALKNLLH